MFASRSTAWWFVAAMLGLIASSSAATVPTGATTLAHGPDGMRVRIDVAPDEEGWSGLVAIPRGKTVRLATAAAGVVLGEPAVMHGLRIAPLSVAANAAKSGSVEVALDFVADHDPVPTRRTRVAASFARLLASQVVGGEELRGQFDEVPGTYLMIVADAVGAIDAVQPLLDWRRRQGYSVVVATTLQTGMTTTQIKNYIQNVYDTAEAPLAFVTLVGDAGGAVVVSTWRETISGYHGEGDHEYTRLDGDDVLADVHIGRLSARSVTELEGIVAKILNYEQAPDTFADPGWFARAVLVGDPSYSGATTIYVSQWLKVQLQALTYTQIDTIWSAPFASQIFSKLNLGASVYSYRGYLNCSGFSTGYIDALTNMGELPFAVMPTCASGSFASATHTYSEAMLRNPGGGAIGAVGTATTGTHTRYNNCYYHGVWEGAVNEPDRHLGYAHTRGKIELYRQYQETEPDIVQVWSVWNNLMGDPATEMRQALPVSPTVDYPAVLPPDAGAVPVSVTSGGAPVVNARVALHRLDEFTVTRWTDTAGEVLLPLPTGLAPGAVDITVSGDDLVPRRQTLQVGATGAYCAVVGWTWSDGGDGMPAPGESGDITLLIRNLGQSVATAVSVDLSALTDAVAVVGAATDLGDIAAGTTVPAGPWTVDLPADLDDGLDVELAVMASSQSDIWRSRAVLPMHAPAFTIDSTVWSGSPGQTSTVTVSLHNSGTVAALGAEATFASTSSFLLAAGPVTVSLGDVVTDGTADAVFLLAVADAAWGGHLANCSLTLTSSAGTSQVLEFQLATGPAVANSPVGPGTMGYLAWDNQDPVADAPAYWWREIDPNHGGVGADVGLTDFGYEQDDTKGLDLPFTFRYRGREYDQISVCSNGWLALGHTYLVHYRNWGLPAAGSPDVLLAVFWDDLRQSGSGRVYYHYNAAAGVYVVQWSRMANGFGGLQNCEVLLYDPAVHPTETGDGLIVFQYDQVTNNDSSRGYATTGIQDGTDGLTWTYYNRYANGARLLQPGRAIAWVPTAAPTPAVAAVSPGSFDVILGPGQTQEFALEIANHGAEGSVLNWQIALQEAAAAVNTVPAADSRDRTVTMLVPNGGETWLIGQSRAIHWNADGGVTFVNLQIDRGAGWETLASGLDAAVGSWVWTVAGPTATSCRMRVVDQQDVLVTDASDGTFSIEADVSWLVLGMESGQVAAGETDIIAVTFDATDLAPGDYTAEIVVLSSGGAPIVVPVHLLVDVTTFAGGAPEPTALVQNTPNPFNPRTVIAFTLERSGPARLTVHDVRGRLLRTLCDGVRAPGRHELVFDGAASDGRPLSSGTYIYRLVADAQVETRRMTLVR